MKYFINIIIFVLIPMLSSGQTDSIEIIARSYINPQSENPVHSILLYIAKPDRNFTYHKGFENNNESGNREARNRQFKIASSTKLFVATVILQLASEGKLSLKDKAFHYLKNVKYLDVENFHQFEGKKYADKITVEQLLSHRTGLADIFSDRQAAFFDLIMANPDKQYTPEAIVDLYYQFQLNEASHFKPDEGWYYSDMNYVLLGLIIESIEQQSLSQSIRDRILSPLKMVNTYFEFYEPPIHTGPLQHQYIGNVNFSELNTSFDWAGGGLISTNEDLSVFIKALFEYKLINKRALEKMIDVKSTKEGENRYGLGIYETVYNGKTFYGHYGFYGSYIGYSPEDKTILSYSISQAVPDFNVYALMSNLLKQVE